MLSSDLQATYALPRAGLRRQADRTLSPAHLGRLVREAAEGADGWRAIVRFERRRWFRRLALTDSYEIWLLSWLPGQGTGFHDHGDACGAFTVAAGELLETLAVPGSRSLRVRTAATGSVTRFGAQHLHAVSNASSQPAISVHAYSPPLSAMRRYRMTESGLTLVGSERAEQDW